MASLERLSGDYMKINAQEIEKLVNKYNNIVIEELHENHEICGNYVTLTCDLEEGYDQEGNISILIGDIYDLEEDLKSYDNIKNYSEETYSNFEENTQNGKYPWYEVVCFSWD